MPTNPLQNPGSLDQLRPIILPTHTASWWPPATGWILLAGILLIFFSILYWVRKKNLSIKTDNQVHNNALGMLEIAYRDCCLHQDQSIGIQIYLQKSNAIIKRYIKHFGKTNNHASLTGDKWTEYLSRYSPPGTTSYSTLYGNQLYSKRCDNNIRLDLLHQWACEWITTFQKLYKKSPGSAPDA